MYCPKPEARYALNGTDKENIVSNFEFRTFCTIFAAQKRIFATAELAQLVEQLIRPKMNEVQVWGSSTRQNEAKGERENKYTAELAQLVEQLIRPKMNEVQVWGKALTKRGERQTEKNKYTAELAQLVEQLIRNE